MQNLFAIFQTWLAKRQPEPELVKRPPRPSFLETMQAARPARMAQQQKNKGPRPPRPGGGSGSAFRDAQRKK